MSRVGMESGFKHHFFSQLLVEKKSFFAGFFLVFSWGKNGHKRPFCLGEVGSGERESTGECCWILALLTSLASYILDRDYSCKD